MSLSLKPEIYNCFQNHKDWPAAKIVLDTLFQAGFKAYLAGGCVRDVLLNRHFQDFDVATSALPDETEKLFASTLNHGKKFGTIVILVGNVPIEVTTFRTDLVYTDGRRPEKICFSDEVEDAKRRDFTMNALFYDIHSYNLLDYVGGVQDINDRIIRTVGSSEDRFSEDYLRMLRALRFQSQLGFEIESGVVSAISKNQSLILKISAERIQKELLGILLGHYFSKCLISLEQIGFDFFLCEYFEGVMNKDLFYNIKKWPQSIFLNKTDLVTQRSNLLLLSLLYFFITFNEELVRANFEGHISEQLKKRIIIFKNKLRLDNSTEKKINSFFVILNSLKKFEILELNSTEEQIMRGYILEMIILNFGDLKSDFQKFLNSTFRNLESDKSKVKTFEIVLEEIFKLASYWQYKLPNKKINYENIVNDYTGAELGRALKLSYYLQLSQPDLSLENLVLEIKKVGPVFFKS